MKLLKAPLFILTAFLLIFVVPLEIISNNIQELRVERIKHLGALFFIAFLFAWFVTELVCYFFAKLGVILDKLALCVVAWYVAIQLLGSFSVSMAWTIAIAVAICVLSVCVLKINIAKRYFVVVLIFYCSSSCFVSLGIILDDVAKRFKNENPRAKINENFGNVYHFVLDGFQGNLFNNLVRSGEYENIKKFSLFENSKAQYWQTHFSLASVFRGDVYKSGSIKDWGWYNLHEQSYLKDVSEKANIYSYVYYEYECQSYATQCVVQKNLEPDFFDEWLLANLAISKLIPKELQSKIGLDQVSIGNQRFEYVKYLENTFGREPIKKTSSTESLNLYDRAVEDEKKRGATGNYVYMHLMIPHEPFNLNEKCSYVEDQPLASSYIRQARCAISLIDSFISDLKRNGKYDKSLIVIHADHGYYLVEKNGSFSFEKELATEGALKDFDRSKEDPSKWSSLIVDGRADVALAIKFPDDNSNGKKITVPVSLLSVKPTVLSHFGVNTSNSNWPSYDNYIANLIDFPIVNTFAYNHITHHSIPRVFYEYRYLNKSWLYNKSIQVEGAP